MGRMSDTPLQPMRRPRRRPVSHTSLRQLRFMLSLAIGMALLGAWMAYATVGSQAERILAAETMADWDYLYGWMTEIMENAIWILFNLVSATV